ncbi:MAG TPA: 6-phosphogluconolactonase [Acidimicrobiales bacterium]|nr:6-phosphogluconolactonase [Acidimicrobiales bacterium]
MHHDLQTFADTDALAEGAARYIADRAHSAVAKTGRFTVAMSGGNTPWAMLSQLALLDVPWNETWIYQVDERIAPRGDHTRNLTHLERCLAKVRPVIKAMAVEDTDLERAARDYAGELPERIDLVHLGLGSDGHTASLIPGDPVLDISDRLIAITGEYQNFRRMTFTYPALASADQILWLVTGSDKQRPLSMLVSGDASIPAGRVEAPRSLIMADQAAT